MARARNIKPGFFTNDRLAEVAPLGRLLFAGLWTICDRAGRLEDRPKRIKAELLPYDDCNADQLLSDLEKQGFIKRYSSGEAKYIQVLNFEKHQNPHMREPESTIPAPCEHSAIPVQEQEENGTGPADSPIPHTESPIHKTNPIGLVGGSPAADTADPCPHKAIIALYHEILPASPTIRDWTPARAEVLRTRWKEDKNRQTLDWWRRFFNYIADSPFLTGRVTGNRGKPFCPGLEWICKAENFAKIREGRYHEDMAA